MKGTKKKQGKETGDKRYKGGVNIYMNKSLTIVKRRDAILS